ncbi:MAG: hypothetical protein MI867_12410 [Pseudomonadales bacterium]|nr:hypothetical protein [Pseudomonadales bacterium]
MAQQVLTNAFISVDGNDISDHVSQVTLNYEAETQDDTAFGDDTRSAIGGLKSWSVSITAQQDWAASQLDSIIFPLIGTTVTIILRKDSGSVSATNPNYTGTGLVVSYNPLDGAVGDLATTPITIQSAGTLSRATS